MRTLITRRALPALAVSFVTAVTLTACGDNSSTTEQSASAVTLTNCGRTVTLTEPASRAVTLNQGATETALSLGAGPQLVGTAYLDDTIAPQWQQAYRQIPVLAEKFPSREQVLEARPDLVLASYPSAFDDKAVGSQDSLARLGIASYVDPFACADKSKRAPVAWDTIGAEIRDYGTMFGRTAEADSQVAQLRTTLAGIESAKPADGRTILWYDSNTDVPYVGGNAGGPQLIIDAVGGRNVFAGLDGAWADGNWETVLEADPDVIVLADASWDTAEAKKQYLRGDPALRDLKAVRDGAFVVLPFSETTPGPRLIDGAASVAKQLGGLRG
ncbi:ABC transporter substrate-binding protein [Speluncibacter jeojiensis]|uniref:ABC transporter substrate-binding protein n=1 Tax=Speluncibacter jeojiensis TaxID=2710754 RepID=UPI002410A410|nr:ABC transporter substrate-binding protein [Rhodococcus sp. D2-41]